MDLATCKKLVELEREAYKSRWLDLIRLPGRKTKSQRFHAVLFEGYFNGYDEALILLNMVDSNESPTNHRHIPKVAVVPRTDGVPGWKFFCGFCDTEHLHGIGLGHREAHCTDRTSSYLNSGYMLVDFDDVKPEWN